MSKRAFWLVMLTGIVTVAAAAGLLIVSIRAGVAPVTVPIMALVLGPALAAVTMVATCSVVAPPPGPQTLMRAVEIVPATPEGALESVR